MVMIMDDFGICQAAQMIARLYNQRQDQSRPVVIPSVTRREAWELHVPFGVFPDPRAFM